MTHQTRRILIINPNTSGEFTARIEQSARLYARPASAITALNPSSGPRSIESVYDELLSAPGTLQLALAEQERYDGFVVACYGDHPAVHAIRELTAKPVLGIAEASMYVACLLGSRFSIVTSNRAWEPLLWAAVRRFGLRDRCASVRAIGLSVLALEDGDDQQTAELIRAVAERAVLEDGAEVICLGCAGMAGLDKQLEAELGVPVLDGVVCALKLLEGLLDYGVGTTKRGIYATPTRKELVQLPYIFNTAYADPPENGRDGHAERFGDSGAPLSRGQQSRSGEASHGAT